MENNDNEMRSIHDHVPSQAQAEPVIESVEEPVVEAVVVSEPVAEVAVAEVPAEVATTDVVVEAEATEAPKAE